MANTNSILTTYASLSQIKHTYQNASDVYIFLGKVDEWHDDNNPPVPDQSPANIKKIYKNIFAVKQLTQTNISGVIPRIDWTYGTTYNQYSDKVNNFTTTNNVISNPFYVRNSYDQIFKCVCNNIGAPSTIEPIVSPGDTNITKHFSTSDGYKWIYVTTIDKGLKQKFFDENWMPISFGTNPPRSKSVYGFGSIDAINIINGGSGYTDGYYTTTVNIIGDGTGATAIANVSNSIVSDIIITNSGNNYTYANVSISPSSSFFSGSGANATVIISPISGNNYDPASELGCNHLMYTTEFNDSENGILPTDVNFRQIGLLNYCSLVNGNTPKPQIYNTCYTATVSFGNQSFISGERVYQGYNINDSNYTATVCSFDSGNNILYLINTVGTPTLGEVLYGSVSGSSRIILNYIDPVFDVGSGYMSYVQNTLPIQRSPNDNEQIRIIIGF